MKQTKCIDDCICPYCGCKFDGRDALNGDMDKTIAICTKCAKEIYVSISVEYICTRID